MVTIEVFVQKDCGYCTETEEKINKLKEKGKLKCPVKFVRLEEGNEKLFDKKNVNSTPTIFVDGKESSFNEMVKKCK